MTKTYLISIGEDDMLGLGEGDDPAAAVEDYYSALDSFGAGSDEIGESFSVNALHIPEELMPEVNDLMEDRFDEALPDVEEMVVGRMGANWHVVDVVIKGGERTATLRR